MKKTYIKENIEIKTSNEFVDYSEAMEFMEDRVRKIICNKDKELIWFLNHDHMYTSGRSSDDNEILTHSNVPIIKTNRGGKTTYHGPGQRIVYFLINLNNRKKDVRKFVHLISISAIQLLAKLDIQATTYPDRVGIWVTKTNNNALLKEKKIGAIGLRIRKWVTYHGLSFNINPKLKFYKNINACGLKNYEPTSTEDLESNLTQENFDKIYLQHFLKKLNSL